MPVTMRPLDADNLAECFLLGVSEEQRNHAQIEETPDLIEHMLADSSCLPFAIYNDDTLVGLIAYAHVEGTSDYRLQRILVDEKHQGHGYGENALRQVIEQLRHREDCERIVVSYITFNMSALHLYAKLDFVETDEFYKAGETKDDHAEIYAILFTSQAAIDRELARLQGQIEQQEAIMNEIQSR